ncbi:MAG: mechanosensitive ion channel [Flavobacteriales bacterium]|nr:mechanosensitive ion channel [Flavobacteriales bacterium]
MKEESGTFETLMRSLGMDLLMLLKVIAILFAAWFVERLIYFALRRGYAKAKAQGREEMTRYRFFRNGVRTMMVILALVAIIYTIPSLRSFALTLFAGAGILAVVIGFAAQKAFSDIISGAFIVAFKPFRVGDFIQAGEASVFGTVEDINLRHTTILTFENRRLVIPTPSSARTASSTAASRTRAHASSSSLSWRCMLTLNWRSACSNTKPCCTRTGSKVRTSPTWKSRARPSPCGW